MHDKLTYSAIQKRFHKHFPNYEKDFADFTIHFDLLSKGVYECEYCGHALFGETIAPHWFAPSLDHRVPKSIGGPNTFENIAIVCTRCNICKGTMTEKTYREMLKSLEPELRETILREMFSGRYAAMLARKEKERELWEFV